MQVKPTYAIQYMVITLGVTIVIGHVQVLEDEDDIDYDYEDYDYTDNVREKLKKPLPEVKNPLREKRQFVQDKQ